MVYIYIYISRPWANPLVNAKTTLYPPPPSPTHGSCKYTTALCYTRVDFPWVRAAGLESRLFSSEGEGGSEVLFPLTTVVRKCIREIRRDTRKTNRVNRVKGATKSIRRGNLENKELKWMWNLEKFIKIIETDDNTSIKESWKLGIYIYICERLLKLLKINICRYFVIRNSIFRSFSSNWFNLVHDISAHLIEWSNFHVTYLPARYKFISMETIWKPLKPDYHILNSCSNRAIPNTCYSLKNFVILLHISAFPEKTRPFTLYETITRNTSTHSYLCTEIQRKRKIYISPKLPKDSQRREEIFFSIFPSKKSTIHTSNPKKKKRNYQPRHRTTPDRILSTNATTEKIK